MSEEIEQIPVSTVKPPITLRPWIVVVGALVLYGLTLNHWVTFASLPIAAQISGWDWHPGPLTWRTAADYQPLTLVLTSPLRLLPVGWRAIALNFEAAIFAALTLAILARSIRLLPYDRAKAQVAAEDKAALSMGDSLRLTQDRAREQRESAEASLLSVRAAFLPATLAVLLLGAQLTFWQNAVSGTGEMINLMVFAFLILCLLEFRFTRKERWLGLFAFSYGVGVANSWALIGFFPCFLAALIWIKRLSFFDWRFLLRTTAWGLLGLLLYGLTPLLGAIAHDGKFELLLRQKMLLQYHLLNRIPRYFLLVASLPSLVPLLFAAINWPFPEGQFSVTDSIARQLFRVIHVVCLAVGIVMFFDLGLSPSPRARFGIGEVSGPGFLSFYYLSALSVGYFGGYVLMVFGRHVLARFLESVTFLRAVNKIVTALFWTSAIALPPMLLFANFQRIQDFNKPAIAGFAKELAESLPEKSAIVLADDHARLCLAEGASQKLGRPGDYIFVDALSLSHGKYLRYLADRYPAIRKELVNPERFPEIISGDQVGLLLAHLSMAQPVYYLHPSFGNAFERVCLTQNRIGEDLHPNPNNALSTVVLKPADIARNQEYWRSLENGALSGLPDLIGKSTDARRIASYYSESINAWGVQLQKAATELKIDPQLKTTLLADANDQFAEAYRLNTNNILARANQQFNARLRGAAIEGSPIDIPDLGARLYYHWEIALDGYGPPDVPELNLKVGQYFAERGNFLQAAHEFERSLTLAPDNPIGELDLAKIYIDLKLVDPALRYIQELQGRFTGNPLELVRVETLANYTKNDFAQADKVLTTEYAKNPRNDTIVKMMAEFYRLIGYAVLRRANADPHKESSADKEAAVWFNKALKANEEHLQLLGSAAANAPEISSTTLRKAELQMTTKNYAAAISTLNGVLRDNPKDPVSLLNRGIAELELNRLDDARKDYEAVEKVVASPWRTVYYGLAQIAQKQKNTSAEIHYDKLYLNCAPTNTIEFANIREHLQKLEAHGG
ncbi:MAG TPA: tetratricopeptide repeat protein [Verrucomicrobiae bacterium]|jgi:tetratricopeptide (TPR) repeat protein